MIDNKVFEEKFKEEIKKEGDPVTVVKNAFDKAGIEYVKTFPVWMRCNYLLNTIANVPEDKRDNIKWDFVNEVLSAQTESLDFNIFDEIRSIDDLTQLKLDSTIAEIPEFNAPYFRKKCKCCNEEFTLTRGEINSYFKKGLKVPSRCYYCRKNIERPKPIVIEKVKEEPVKTAMQIAMEKAGIK